jgi:succinate-semialdehyde dehydrogenase/glutarate-semialdehyde dehydrogenase
MAVKTLADVRNKSLLRNQGFIDGKWVDVVDPASLDKLASIPEMGTEDTVAAVETAHSAFKTFKETKARERARLLRRWNDLCLQNIDDLALNLSLENGKTLAEARGEVVYGASFIEWFTGEAERFVGLDLVLYIPWNIVI